MTHEIRDLGDGWRRYSNGTKYRLRLADERRMHGPRFRGEDGQWFGSRWLPNLVLLDDEERAPLPPTRPDDDAWYHPFGCGCDVCQRDVAIWWKRAKLTHEEPPRAGPRSAHR